MTLLKALIGVLVGFGGFVALMYLTQRSLMYFPDKLRTEPAAAGFPLAAYLQVKTLPNPAADWQHRLVDAFSMRAFRSTAGSRATRRACASARRRPARAPDRRQLRGRRRVGITAAVCVALSAPTTPPRWRRCTPAVNSALCGCR